MRPDIARYNFFLMVLWSLALLGLGRSAEYAEQPTRMFLQDLHVSLGLVGAISIVVQIVLRTIFPPTYPARCPRWLKTIGYISEYVAYVSFVAMAGSGVLWTVFRGTPLQFFGAALPVFDIVDRPLVELLGPILGAPLRASGADEVMSSAFFRDAHRLMAFVLAGSIFARIGVAVLSRFTRSGATAPAPHVVPRASGEREEAPSSPESKPAQSLATKLRVFGWIEFWLQLVLALVSALLLQFSTSGRAFSPGSSGLGDAIYWSFYGFLLLCAADALAFYYTRAANKIVSRPSYYLSEARKTAFWFLYLGLLTGMSGIFISFTGVSLSILLLIAKTVSQPPGIAITDPNKIVRALDVFILLVNFNLLIAHFIGTGATLWLGVGALNARLRYASTRRRNDGA